MGNAPLRQTLVLGLPRSGKSAIIAALTDGCSGTYSATFGYDERMVQDDILMVELGGKIITRWLTLLRGPLKHTYNCIILCVNPTWPPRLLELSKSILLRTLCGLRGETTLSDASLLVVSISFIDDEGKTEVDVEKALQLSLMKSRRRVAILRVHPTRRPLHTALAPMLKWIRE